MKQKSFHKGIEQLVQEGAVQLYQSYSTGDYILGAVGQLQFEVFQFRMANEYNSEVVMEPMGKRLHVGLLQNNLMKRCRVLVICLSRIGKEIRCSCLKMNFQNVGSRINILTLNLRLNYN